MLSRAKIEEDFIRFVTEVEPKLSRALVAAYGPEVGRESTRDALAYAWENWDRVAAMDNQVGYLYRVGQSRSRSYRRRRVLFPEVNVSRLPHVEPGLPKALARLTQKQRTALVLLHVDGLSEREVAEAMGISRASVRKHADRGMAKLRIALEVADD